MQNAKFKMQSAKVKIRDWGLGISGDTIIQSIIQSFSQSINHSFTHSLIHSFTHSNNATISLMCVRCSSVSTTNFATALRGMEGESAFPVAVR